VLKSDAHGDQGLCAAAQVPELCQVYTKVCERIYRKDNHVYQVCYLNAAPLQPKRQGYQVEMQTVNPDDQQACLNLLQMIKDSYYRPREGQNIQRQHNVMLDARRSFARHWVWRCRYSPPSPAATNARPPCAAVSSSYWTLLSFFASQTLHNRKNFKKKSGDVNDEANFSFFILLHKRAKPIHPPYLLPHSARELKPYTPPFKDFVFIKPLVLLLSPPTYPPIPPQPTLLSAR
jgi:hypothetical protein